MKKTILFVCTGNTCRSPMAEAILKEMVREKGEGYEVISAGTSAGEGEPAAGEAVRALEEEGIVLSGHRSRPVTGELLDRADLVITMTRGHKERVLEMRPQAGAKTFTLKEFSAKMKGDEKVERILELDREEAQRRRDFQAQKGQEEQRLLARREQLKRDLREVERHLFELHEEKNALLEDIRTERDLLVEERGRKLDVSDPFGGSLKTYQATRDEIRSELENLLQGLKEEEE